MTSIFTLLIIVLICGLATNQTVDVLHHSQAGTPYRRLAAILSNFKWTSYIGDLLSCPYCYSHYVSFLYVGWFAFNQFNLFEATVITFIGGLVATRIAGITNDLMGPYCRTPNVNDNSATGKANLLQQQATNS